MELIRLWNTPMKGDQMIVIMGSGSVGSLIGGLLSSKGHDVILIGRESHITAIWKKGLFITGLVELHTTPKAVTSASEAEKSIGGNSVDFILITTKAHQTKQAVEDIKPLVSENTALVSIQNGLGTEDVIKEEFPDNIVLRCVTSIGINRPTDGVIDYSGKGSELVGFTTNPACYGFVEGTPKYYPKIQEMHRFAYMEGCIIIRVKEEISKSFLNNLISKINSFCGFFELETAYRVDKTEDYYLIEFDTESG